VFVINTVRIGTTLLKKEGDVASIVKEFSYIVIRSLATVTGSNIYVATAINKESLNV
jgi:hypothetical protein